MKQLDTTEVWAQLLLSANDSARVQDFFLKVIGVQRRCLVRAMHITVYYSRRPMPGLEPVSEPASLIIPAQDMRFMVMAPGGENSRPELDPASRKIGVRVHKPSTATPHIRAYRDRLLKHETEAVLGKRAASTHATNAFGARHFQPHMSVLRAGSGVDRDLRTIGDQFRESLGSLTFDTFCIDIVHKTAGESPNSSFKPTPLRD